MQKHPVHLLKFGLSAKLALCLVAGALIILVIFGFLNERLERRQLETLVSLSAMRISDIIHFSAWQAMLDNDRARLHSLIRDIAREPGLRRIRIINEDGQVRVSNEPREAGTMIDKTAEACYGCHAQSRPLERLKTKDRTRIFLENGQRTLAIIRPIENHEECSNAACHAHPAARRVLGVIDVHLTLEAVDQQLAEHRRQMAAFIGGAALFICLFSLGFVWRFVHRPVRALMRGTNRLAEGDLGYRIQVESSDELGMLAESFNEMAQELGEANAGLRQAAHTLEERVKRKTAELEAAQRGLIQTEKMVSLGRLAATVAHEVNNPLFGMLTYARLTIKDLERGHHDEASRARMMDNLRIIERESRRCGDLMKNLLAFARQAPPQRAPVQLNVVVDRAVKLVTHQYELAGTALVTELAPGLPDVPCDAAQVQQVLIVLLVNAAEALGKSGEVVVRTAAAPDRQGVVFSVSDNGPGVPPELAEKIFEPFFSTKDHQHRTGLGLAVAKGIVDRHGGSIEMHSSPGAGAEFVIHLPLIPAPAGAEAPPAETAAFGSNS